MATFTHLGVDDSKDMNGRKHCGGCSALAVFHLAAACVQYNQSDRLIVMLHPVRPTHHHIAHSVYVSDRMIKYNLHFITSLTLIEQVAFPVLSLARQKLGPTLDTGV